MVIHSPHQPRSSPALNRNERWQRILARARTDGQLAVADIAQALDVAQETVRRDLAALESHGLIRRTHGAAYPVEGAGYEATLLQQAASMLAEKQRIAVAAAELLRDATTIYLDEGYTTQLVAQQLARQPATSTPTVVVTTAVQTARILADDAHHFQVYLLGGHLRPTQMTTAGWSNTMLESFDFDVAVISTSGITVQRGLTTTRGTASNTKRAAISRSRVKILVAAHTKFGVDSFIGFAQVAEFTTLVTDDGLSAAAAKLYNAAGPQILRT